MEIFLILIFHGMCFLIVKLAASRKRPTGSTIVGKAWVTDGDGIKVNGYEIRISGIDVPEFDQLARFYSGKSINQSRLVKSVLIRKVGGKPVTVKVKDTTSMVGCWVKFLRRR